MGIDWMQKPANGPGGGTRLPAIRRWISMIGVMAMLPCRPGCPSYQEGCHKTCAQWQLFQEEQRAQRRNVLEAERARLQAELPTIKGLFSGGKRKQVEARLSEIEAELKKL